MVLKKDVKSDSSPDEKVVEEEEESSSQETTPVEDTPEQQSSETEDVKEEKVDERGVPYKNVAMEYKRKYEELLETQKQLPNYIQEAVRQAVPQSPRKEEYTKEQLIQYKNSVDDPNQKAWAETQLEILRTKEIQDTLNKQLEAERQRATIEQGRQQSLMAVYQNYPIMFNKDGSWNNENPLTREMARIYNSDESLKNHPNGLKAAADMAFAKYALSKQPDLVRQQKQLKRDLKKAQNKTLSEGGGTADQPDASPLVKALHRHAQTGSDSDLQEAMKEYFKTQGIK